MITPCRRIVDTSELHDGVEGLVRRDRARWLPSARGGGGVTGKGPARLLVLLLVGLSGAASVEAAPKTDVVVLKNGDHVTCEIKSLNRGKLKVKTDDMGTVDIEWTKIESVTARGLFEIEDLFGHLYYGPLVTVPGEGLQVAAETGVESIPLLAVVRLLPIKTSFWQRLSGRFDLGLAYTKSSTLAQLNADGNVKFVRPTFTAELQGSSAIQRQEGVNDTTRNNLAFSYTRNLEGRRFALGRLTADQNRELGYELRAGVVGGWGKYFVRSQGNEILGAAGLYLNQEVPVDGDSVTNLEALIGADWANFAYDFPKTDVEVNTVFIVGLTDWGRYRVDIDARVSRELFSDFTVSVKGYYNYDSRPPTEDAAKDDYQINLAVGYTF